MAIYERKLTDDQARKLLHMFYEDGVGVGTLELLFPVSRSTIYAILRGRAYHQPGFDYDRFAAVRRPPANKRRTDEAVETAKRMRREGATYKQIAERLGVHLVTVREWIIR